VLFPLLAWIAAAIVAVIAATVVLALVTRSRLLARRTLAAARVDEANERRIEDAERAHLAPAVPADSFPAVTAALAIVARAAVQHHDPEFAPGAEAAAAAV
jgi:hypothetical protein